jgi:hypothetical protein
LKIFGGVGDLLRGVLGCGASQEMMAPSARIISCGIFLRLKLCVGWGVKIVCKLEKLFGRYYICGVIVMAKGCLLVSGCAWVNFDNSC